MLRPSSLFSLVVVATAVAVAAGASVWQPGDSKATLARSTGLHLMAGHLPRWFDEATTLHSHQQTTHKRQPNPDPPVDVTFVYDRDFRSYMATLYVGSPPQPLATFLDITSTQAWAKSHNIDGNQFYNHSESSTYKANGTHFNMGNFYHGVWSSDDFTLGDPKKHSITLHDQFFIELTGSDEALGKLAADGLMGFGNGDVSFMAGTAGPMRNLINNGRLEEPVVGLYLDEHEAHTMIGGIDAAYTQGPVTYFPAKAGDSTWSIPVEGIAVGGKVIEGTQARADLMLSWPAFIGPADQLDAIADAVGVDSGWIPCNATAPDITIQLSKEVHVTLTKHDYTMPSEDENVCQFIMLGIPGLDEWTFGVPFLRKVYTVLDYGTSKHDARVGIAPLHIGH